MAGSVAEIAYKNMKEEFRNFKSSDANVYLIEQQKYYQCIVIGFLAKQKNI